MAPFRIMLGFGAILVALAAIYVALTNLHDLPTVLLAFVAVGISGYIGLMALGLKR